MSAAPSERPPLGPSTWLPWLGIGALVVLARLPYRVQRGLGALLGALLFRFLRGRRRFAARNLELCFPELDPGARDRRRRGNCR
jgi:KDO2-lipid IV(A) lauroyltransferase